MAIVVYGGQRWDDVELVMRAEKLYGPEVPMLRWESRCVECDGLLVCFTLQNYADSKAFARVVCRRHGEGNVRGPGKKWAVNT